jgi:CRISPR-associated endonuclease/helicase Cas3
MPPYYAHSGRTYDQSDWQPLSVHLEAVARRARCLLEEALPAETGLELASYAAGMLHDLGKYRPEFQAHLRSIQVPRQQTYHKQTGAAKVLDARKGPA